MWFEQTNMNDQRSAAYAMMDLLDEGLAPRAYRTLLQIGDNDPRLMPADAAWLFDPLYPEGAPLVEWQGIQAGYALTAFGQQIYNAANRGDWKTIVKLTTDPNIDGVLN